MARGFALVTDQEGALVRSADALSEGQAVTLKFHDGPRAARIGEGEGALAGQSEPGRKPKAPKTPSPEGPSSKKAPAKPKPRRRSPPEQGSLF